MSTRSTLPSPWVFDNFVIDGRYNIGVTKVPKHGDGYTNVVQLTLGYKFKL